MADVERRQDRSPVPSAFEYAEAPESREIVRLEDRYGLFVGGEWHHMSNGHDKKNNPPTDGINIYTGLMFTW